MKRTRSKLSRIVQAGLVALLLPVLPLRAADRPVVVELFTSQGCSACPPADAFLSQLAARDDVIALSLHVDYWDYLGWKDTFASPAHTARQRAYADAAGRSMVYTPQIIVAGTDQVIGTRFREVIDLIDKHRATGGADLAMDLRREGDQVHLEARAQRGPAAPLIVLLARYAREATVDVKRGENAGRKLSYTNSVSELRRIATWSAQTHFSLSFDWPRDAPLAVLLQHPDHGPIAAAARLP